jgi:hypothetical protein
MVMVIELPFGLVVASITAKVAIMLGYKTINRVRNFHKRL